jgi:hypothetical protein
MLSPALAWSRPDPVPSGGPQDAAGLFEKGRALYDEGRFAEACDALAASDSLDPSIGAAGLLAACLEAKGLIATAYRKYVDAADRASAVHDARETFARERADALRPRLPILIVRTNRSESGLEVYRDGEVVRLGTPEFVDPGLRHILARAPSKKEWHTSVSLSPGERLEVIVPPLEGAAPARTTTRAPARPLPAAVGTSTQRPIGWVALGLGSVGIGVGTVTGLMAVVSKNELDDSCGDDLRTCPTSVRDDAERYNGLRTATTLALGIGAGVAVLGAVLALTAPPAHAQKRSRTALRVRMDGTLLGARF